MTDSQIEAGLRAVLADIRKQVGDAVSNTPPGRIYEDIDFICAMALVNGVPLFKRAARLP